MIGSSKNPDIIFVVSHANTDSMYMPFYYLYLAGYLEKHGFIEPVKFEGRKIQSKTSITDYGRGFLEKFDYPLRELCEEEKSDSHISDVDVGRAIELYYPHSGANRKSLSDRYAAFENIYNALQNNEGFRGLRPVDFAERCGIGRYSTNTYLQLFLKEGWATREVEGRTVFYHPKINA